MNELIEILEELNKNISKIKNIMDITSTGRANREDFEDEYEEIYTSIGDKITELKRYNIHLIHLNPHLTLDQFYSFYKGKPAYSKYVNRRNYIASKYESTENKINQLLVQIDANTEFDTFVREIYLDIDHYPDDFYRDLINLINNCYSRDLYAPIPLFIRKILENLLIDILRDKYGHSDISKFYDASKGRFHSFSILLKTLKDNLSDFSAISSIDTDLIREINQFRVQGNSHAHTLELDLNNVKNQLDSSKNDINFLIKKMIRAYGLI